MPPPTADTPTATGDFLRQLSKQEMWIHIILYTYEVFILKVPGRQVTDWPLEAIDSWMNIFLDNYFDGINPVPLNLNSIIIQYAIDHNWTVNDLVWCSIAIRLNSLPILWAAIQECANCSTTTGTYAWRMPVPINRTIRPIHRVALPSRWFEDWEDEEF